ncbi:ankyrin repeat domain-containing protein [Candidatus Dependentiae bacterium]|nr:ankyrin repeat domain-containing protein [Candidatus Dependentiae bacterium]
MKKLILFVLLCIQADHLMAMNNNGNSNNKRDHDQFNSDMIIDLDECEDEGSVDGQPQKKRKKLKNKEDLFERLPDEIILQIYSYLPLEDIYNLIMGNETVRQCSDQNDAFIEHRLREMEESPPEALMPRIYSAIFFNDKSALSRILNHDFSVEKLYGVNHLTQLSGSYRKIGLWTNRRAFLYLFDTDIDHNGIKHDCSLGKTCFILNNPVHQKSLKELYQSVYKYCLTFNFETIPNKSFECNKSFTKGNFKVNPLAYAVSLSKRDLVPKLLYSGVPFYAEDSFLAFTQPDKNIVSDLLVYKKLDYSLHYAVDQGDTQLAIRLIRQGYSFNEDCKDERYPRYYDKTPLEMAIKNNNLTIVKVLLNGTNPKNISEKIDMNRDVSISQAINSGNKALIQYLIDCGFPVTNKDARGNTPLLHAFFETEQSKNDEILLLISNVLQRSAQDKSKSLIHYAAEGGCLDLIKKFHRQRVNPISADSLGKTPLHYAAEFASERCAEYLLRNGAVLDTQDNKEKTPLHYAVEHKAASDFIKYLLECGANPNKRDEADKNALEYALEGTASNCIISDLLNYGGYTSASYRTKIRDGEFNVKNKPSILKTILALEKGKEMPKLPFSEDRYILQNRLNSLDDQRLTDKDRYGKTRLHYAAQLGQVTEVESLLKKGVDVNIQDFVGRTPLHYASWSNNTDPVLKALIAKGASTTMKDHSGKTCLDYAPEWNRRMIVKLLEEKSKLPAQRVVTQNTPLPSSNNVLKQVQNQFQEALNNGLQQCAMLCKQSTDINAQDSVGRTVLSYAVQLGKIDLVRGLLAKNADPNISDKSGKTPLLYALEAQNQEVLSLLLSHLATRGPNMPLNNRKVQKDSDLENDAMWVNYPPLAFENYIQYKKNLASSVVTLLPQAQFKPNIGIINETGTDCFMNASLQVLSNLSDVQNVFVKNEYKSDSLTGKLIEFFNRLKTEQGAILGSKELRNFITSIDDVTLQEMKSGQQDAQEFISALISNLDEDIKNIFKIELEYSTLCSSKRHSSSVNQQELLLSLPLPDQANQITTQELCTNFFNTEAAVKEYSCRTCNETMNNASRTIKIKTLPSVLVLAVKRFAYENNNAQRINTPLVPQEILTLEDEQGVKNYELKSVICQRGEELARGHYFAFVKHDSKWHFFNDTATGKTLLAPSSWPYIYFYQRVSQKDKTGSGAGL